MMQLTPEHGGECGLPGKTEEQRTHQRERQTHGAAKIRRRACRYSCKTICGITALLRVHAVPILDKRETRD